MNNPNNLFNMMQTGGLTSSAGGTRLARAVKRQSDIKRLEKQQKREARRQKRGGIFGSVAGLAGGLLGAAIPGLGLALGAGLGTGLGRLLGEKIGAGKSRSYDRSGTVFGQQAFRDVSQASRDYTRGMGERAITSGLKAALTGGLSKDGGIYGSKFNPFMEGSKFRQRIGSFADPSAIQPIPLEQQGGLLGDIDMTQSNLEMAELLNEQVAPMSLRDKLSYGIQDVKALGLPRMLGIGGKSFAENVTRQGMLDNADLLMGQDIDEFAFLDDVQEQPNMQASLLGLRDKVNQYNNVPQFKEDGLLGFRRGAFVPGDEGFGGGANTTISGNSGQAPLLPSAGSYSPFSVALGAGFELTPEQASLISDFDPSSIESAKSQYQQNLLGMTGGMGLSSMGQGFGARARAGQEALSSAGEAIADVTSEAEAQYESSVLGQMADLISGGAEFEVADSVPQQPPSNPGTLPGQQQEGSDGRNYIWTGVSWMAT
jgi:hypothetical protein